jgi:hypothetical protein
VKGVEEDRLPLERHQLQPVLPELAKGQAHLEQVECLRGILNFTPGSQGWTSPLGVNFAPMGEIFPLGGVFTPLFTPGNEHSLLYRRMEGQTGGFTPRG